MSTAIGERIWGKLGQIKEEIDSKGERMKCDQGHGTG